MRASGDFQTVAGLSRVRDRPPGPRAVRLETRPLGADYQWRDVARTLRSDTGPFHPRRGGRQHQRRDACGRAHHVDSALPAVLTVAKPTRARCSALSTQAERKVFMGRAAAASPVSRRGRGRDAVDGVERAPPARLRPGRCKGRPTTTRHPACHGPGRAPGARRTGRPGPRHGLYARAAGRARLHPEGYVAPSRTSSKAPWPPSAARGELLRDDLPPQTARNLRRRWCSKANACSG